MHNSDVKQILDDCENDLSRVDGIIASLGATSNIVPYLTKYGIIRASGALEVAFKTIIVDYCSWRSKKQLKQYLSKKIRDGSMNPSYDNIIKLLSDFDGDWKTQFKTNVTSHPSGNRLKTSLNSLVDARNDFAHGGNPTITISDVRSYFGDSRIIMEILDTLIH